MFNHLCSLPLRRAQWAGSIDELSGRVHGKRRKKPYTELVEVHGFFRLNFLT